MAQRVSNSEACREVCQPQDRYPITVRPAIVTDDGHTRRYPALDQPTMMSGRFLGQDERVMIADQLQAGVSLRRIAAQLRRSRSKSSREVTRNRDQAAAGTGRSPRTRTPPPARPKVGKLTDPALRDYVQESL